MKIAVRGAVQGVGFRPFVYRLATELNLKGWVINSAQGVFIEIEGAPGPLSDFMRRLRAERPGRAIIQSCEASHLDPRGYEEFEIRESSEEGGKSALILPDIATCDDCLREIFDPTDRRFRYPFTNCTNCGPRFSIIEALPYDRANTAMKKFAMCADCAREYRDPADRRFHAEPTACPHCGPQLELWDSSGTISRARRSRASTGGRGRFATEKSWPSRGLAVFNCSSTPRNQEAVLRLRERKHREEKPFAVMFPSLQSIRACCEISELEEQLLTSPESPIVLLARNCGASGSLAASLAPRNPNLGVMLPYSPLHHLLLRELNFPVVATSGNLSDEPICIDEHEALERLRGIADSFLVHDRPIVRHVDDSIVRVVAGREMMLRRARGYAPLPITLRRAQATVLAVGAHLKNAVALSVERNVFISQHIGDLATKQAHNAFARSAADLPRLYAAKLAVIAHDLHPDYLSTIYALQQPGEHVAVQHHWAHIASCMAENEIEPPLLGVAWDGTGYGIDGTIWGGEFFLARKDSCQRVAHLRTFRLPGGEAAVKEPRRSALGLLHEIFGDELWERKDLLDSFGSAELKTLRSMFVRQINSPVTSSAGRLFDAVAALSGLRARTTFEGQAAMELEFAVAPAVADSYPFTLREGSPLVIDWEPAIRALLEDRRQKATAGLIAAHFHNMLADSILSLARHFAEFKILLSGGCFQNRYLTERVIDQLRRAGFQPYWHQRVPPNDGGIALGQVWLANSEIREIT